MRFRLMVLILAALTAAHGSPAWSEDNSDDVYRAKHRAIEEERLKANEAGTKVLEAKMKESNRRPRTIQDYLLTLKSLQDLMPDTKGPTHEASAHHP